MDSFWSIINNKHSRRQNVFLTTGNSFKNQMLK